VLQVTVHHDDYFTASHLKTSSHSSAQAAPARTRSPVY
jgi:hypothetical protein